MYVCACVRACVCVCVCVCVYLSICDPGPQNQVAGVYL